MRNRVGDVDRIAVGVPPISKSRTRIQVPVPVIQIVVDPSEILTWRCGVPSPAKRGGSARRKRVASHPPVRVRCAVGGKPHHPALPDAMMLPKSRSLTLKKGKRSKHDGFGLALRAASRQHRRSGGGTREERK